MKNVHRFIKNYMPAVLAATVMLTLFLAYRDRVAYEHCIFDTAEYSAAAV